VDWREVPDELWERLKPLLPKRLRRRRWPGRKPLDDRACLNGILFVLSTGIRWDRLPQQLGYGSGMTCWRRLRDWQQAGVWDRLHALLLAELQASGRIDWSRAVADSSHIRAKGGDDQVGPSSVDRGRPGSKHHLVTDATGIPLAVRVTGANRNDVTQLLPLIEQIPPARGRPGRPRRRPERLVADPRLRFGRAPRGPSNPGHSADDRRARRRARIWIGPLAVGH
jgi:transposase